MIHLMARSQSVRKGLYRRDVLRRLAERVCQGEGFTGDAEVSVLFCDDAFIGELNRKYRHRPGPTDVLAFAQAPADALLPGHRTILGDIVISLETVEARCGDRAAMRAEVRVLFCHGLLHLLGCTHDTAARRDRMLAKQADYLGVPRGK